MKNTFGICLVWWLLLADSSQAFQSPHGPELPNFDKRRQVLRPAAADQGYQAGVIKLQERLAEARVERREGPGRSVWVFSSRGFLSGPNGEGLGITPAAVRSLPVNDPHRATKAFLSEHSDLFGHGPEALQVSGLKRDFITPRHGMRSVVWEQQVDGLPVFQALLVSHVTTRGELISVASGFVPHAEQSARSLAPIRVAPPIPVRKAIALAAAEAGENLGPEQVRELQFPANAEGDRRFTAPNLNGETTARLVWLPMPDDSLRLCWEVVLTSHRRGEMFRLLVEAQSGEVLVRHSLTAYLTNATYRVFLSDSPTPFSPGWGTPMAGQPAQVSRTLIVTNAVNTNASPNGWINDADNVPRGNNVDAHTDRNGDDQADVPRTRGAPFRVFDFPLDLAQGPESYTNASVVQLFYWCNWMHDKLYELGFTEAAGNFQTANFTGSGLGGDAVQADAQDGAALNNANMTTHPADGRAPRLQMFVWNTPTPARDGCLDAEIILHEYTHGLTTRRVGGGAGLNELQSQGLGEGWSDFYPLALLSEAADDVDATYAMGAYVSYQLGGTAENYYFGIRRYPYSSDLAKNPLTFKDIDPTQAGAHPGVPRNPALSNRADNVHSQGEVWCAVLWDARARLIHKYGFEAGNALILELVTDGLNLSPANPTFLEARDALLLADLVNSGGADRADLWQVFSRRGLGFSALAPPHYTTIGVREAFDMPDDLLVLPLMDQTFRGPMGGPFAPPSRVYTLTNAGDELLDWSAGLAAPTWMTLSQAAGSLPPGASLSLTVQLNALASSLPEGIYTNVIHFTNRSSSASTTRRITLGVGLPDPLVEIFGEGEFDLANTALTFTPDGSPNFYEVCREPAQIFSTDPTGGSTLGMDDDSFVPVGLPSGFTVSLFGVRTNVLFIGSNGYLNWGEGDQDNAPGTIFNRPRIAAMMTDLDPRTGNVSLRRLEDRVAITFRNVPQSGKTNSNNFQFELFTNGVIRLTWLRMDTRAGAVGLSRGNGVPAAFVGSDLSAAPTCRTRRTILFDSRLKVERCAPPNGVVDPGETVTLDLALINAGGLDLHNVLVRLEETANVTDATGPISYPGLISGGPPVTNNFTFTANGPCGGTFVATFVVTDGADVLATVPLIFDLGVVRRFVAFLVKNSAISIPELGPANPYPSSNMVTGLPGLVTRATVSLSGLSHASPEDLTLLLVAPSGQKAVLMSGCGGSFAINNVALTLDDTAPALPDATVIGNGNFRPTVFGAVGSLASPAPPAPYPASLSVFNGVNPNGAWRLFVEDRAGGNAGSIIGGWTLNLNTADATCCLDPAAADLALGMSATPNPAARGGEVLLGVSVTNRGPAVATDVKLTAPLPSNVTFLGVSASQGNCVAEGGVVNCDVGSLASNAFATATIRMRTEAAGPLTHSASTTTRTADVNMANNSAQIITPVLAPFAIVTPTRTATEFRLFISTEPGLTYFPEFKNELSEPFWQPLPPLLGDGAVKTVIDLLPHPLQRFYRVRIE